MIEVAIFTAGILGPLAVVGVIWMLLPVVCPLMLLVRSLVRKGIPAGSGVIATLFAIPYALPVRLVPGGPVVFCAMWVLVLLPISTIYVVRMADEPRARPWEIVLLALPYLLAIPLSQIETKHHPFG